MTSRGKARRITLPSQRVVEVTIARDARGKPAEKCLFGDALALLASDRLVVTEGRPPRRLDAAAIDALALADFHVLRDLAIREKLVPSEDESFPCDNCDRRLTLAPAALPASDLDDRYEGEEPLAPRVVELPEAVRARRVEARRVRMRPVTVAEARPLWRELARDRPFRITPALLRAMGVVALVPEGRGEEVTDLREVARALVDASDESWSEVEATFVALAYPPRAITTVVCPSCETVHDMEVPWPRELEPGQYHSRPEREEAFPDAASFEAHARTLAAATWKKMDAGGLTLRIEVGVPEVDSGGVPMLGSYTPEARDDGGTDFVVRVYYRTFDRSFRDDADFDWQHELAETIEHEAQHHLYYLSGHDPMDAQERAESERELVRRVGGEKRYRKLQRRALLGGVWDIVRVLVPALALVAVAVLVLSRCAS